jgi:ABC-type antimicrobial peptide transport system permease subunit
MAEEEPKISRHRRPRRAVLGMAAALVGLALVSAMLAVSHGRTPFLEHALFQLGLGGTALIAAIGQVLILGGLALLWSALRRTR